MYPAPTRSPEPDATHVPIGRRAARLWTLLGVALAALAVLGTFLRIATGSYTVRAQYPLGSVLLSGFVLLLCGTLAFLCLRHARKIRGTVISTDSAGLWLTDDGTAAVVPWNDVAGIGLHEYVVAHSSPLPDSFFISWSLDLRLHEPIDRGDPLVERLLLPADPPRYMIRLPRGTHVEAMAAVKARVPELWLEAPEPE
ncbi:hypothetical protein [Glycomyces sp. NPDC048151]|uniref:hypothetical protein n=1 Tax=Glycomyces sp. NPDC048151 TaxID=3364002 RepID=UPI00371A448D